MNPYVQIIAACVFVGALVGIGMCLQKSSFCNVISYLTLFFLSLCTSLLAMNVYYSIQHYHTYLNNPTELIMVLVGVGILNVLFYFTMIKPMKKVNTYIPVPLLLVSYSIFNAYYLGKQLL